MRLENDGGGAASVTGMKMQVDSMKLLVERLTQVLAQLDATAGGAAKHPAEVAPTAYGNDFAEALNIHGATQAARDQVSQMINRLQDQIEAMGLTVEMTRQRTADVDQAAADRFVTLYRNDHTSSQR